MYLRLLAFLSGSVFLLVRTLVLPLPLQASAAASAWLAAPQTENFPQIETYLQVHDEQGNFVRRLEPADLQILEDDRPVEVTMLKEVRPGVQVVFALDPGPAFGVRDSHGVSRHEYVLNALADWAASRRGATTDDLSLLIAEEVAAAHLDRPEDFLAELPTDAPADDQVVQPDLGMLSRAIDMAADPLDRPGMGRAVLYVTPLPERPAELPFDTLAERARQRGIRVFVWMVAAPGTADNPGAQGLAELAASTGGRFFAFSGLEPLPGIEDYLDASRSAYRVQYTSQLREGGAHQLSAVLVTESGEVAAPAQTFQIEIEPPNPIFVSPELEIQRKPPPGVEQDPEAEVGPAEYLPVEHRLELLIEFPDGRARELRRTTLFVDGQTAAENTSPPFDRFVWDLSQYTADGSHVLRVEAEDILGLTGSSIETLVDVQIQNPEAEPWESLTPHMPAAFGLLVVVVTSIVLLVLVVSGRIQPRGLRVSPRFLHRRRNASAEPEAVEESSETGLPNWINRLHWPQRRVTPQALAFLSPLHDSPQSQAAKTSPDTPIPLTAGEMILGSDANRATLVLRDPSVCDLHARLVYGEDNSFMLYDQGSIAGTWVNYELVGGEGRRLQHGDCIHIGRIGFRFTLRQPHTVLRPVVTPEGASAADPEEATAR